MVEGQLLVTSGRGVAEYTIREICNIAYYLITSKFEAPGDEDDPTVEEQIELFEEKIGQRVNAEERAEQLMRERMIAMGLDPDAKPEISPELQAKMDQDAARMMSNEELMFGGAAYEGKEIRGKKIKNEGM